MTKIVTIDSGHGGWDPGAVAVDGRPEKSTVLELGLAVRDALAAYDVQVIVTRTTDVALAPKDPPGADLHARAALANQAKADLFLSLHHDAADGPDARGASLYEWTKKKGWLKALDGGTVNHTDPKTHPLALVALPILQDTFAGLGIPWRGGGVMCSDFQVLRDTTMPAMLLECFFGTSPADVAIARRPDFIPTLAAGVARAVAAALGLILKAPPAPKETPIPVYVNGGDSKPRGRTLQGVVRDGTTYVTINGLEIPLRPVAVTLGCTVEYIGKENGGPAVLVSSLKPSDPPPKRCMNCDGNNVNAPCTCVK